jgi:RNA polymerase sigma-70 factor, ECF subfamily
MPSERVAGPAVADVAARSHLLCHLGSFFTSQKITLLPVGSSNTNPRMVRSADLDLMQRVKGGEVEAFEAIVERHKSVVYGLCFSMLRSREDAEEASQDTFLKLFRSRDLFDASRPLQPWLLRIAGNTSRDVMRRRMAAHGAIRTGDSELLMKLLEDPRSMHSDDRAATRQAVRHAIDSMKDRFREPLVLRYLNGLSNRQIADALGISVSNVKIRLARAKDVLHSRLSEVRD